MSRYYLYIDTAPAIFKARINMPGAITYPVTSLLFDGVTTGAYTDIQADMTLLLGSADGLDDYGRVRVQNIATVSEIPLGRTSQGTLDGEIDIVDNAYITVLNEYRVWSKIPRIDDDGNQYKDTTVLVGGYTSTDIPPVANCGPGTAGTIDSGTSLLTVDFDGTGSYAVADGATIATYGWDVGGGTITVGTSASSAITVTFAAGRHIVALTVTDDNGNSHTARCLVYARNPASDGTIQVFSADLRIGLAGQEATIELGEPATFADGSLVTIWEGEPFNAADRGHVHFIGWHQADDTGMRATVSGNVPTTTLHCVDVAGKLKTLPGFPQELRAATTITNWDEMTAPNIDKYLHYLLQWHSTALSLADFTLTGLGSTYPFVVYASEGESLFDQVENDAKGLVPTYHLACNRQGQMAVNVDPMLQDVADRTSSVIGAFNEANLKELRFSRTRPPRVHWLRKHALLTATDYTDIDGTDTLLTAQCIAPGEAPGQGVNAVETTEGLAPSQAALNNAGGHEYARANAPYGLVTVMPPDDSVYIDVEPAELQWVTLTMTAATAAQRGYTFTTTRAQVKEIRRRLLATPTGSYATSEFHLELETSGNPATTVIPEGSTYSPYVPTPPSFGIITGQELLAAISSDGMLYTTSDFQTVSGSGGPTWAETDLSITDTTLFSFVVDPFSPGYINGTGTGAVNGWVVGETNIWRVTDFFGTPGASIVHTFSTAISASSVFVSRTIGASFGRFFATDADNPWLLCISHYADAAGKTGTWATYSIDAGVTWATEVEISSGYDTDLSGNDPANVPALYMSPRVPGFAYSAGYTMTDSPAPSSGYATYDWGQTWVSVGADPVDDPAYPQPYWGLMDASDNLVEVTVGPTKALYSAAIANEGENITDGEWKILLAPPADAVRVEVSIDYIHTRSQVHTSGKPAPAFSTTYDLGTATNTSIVEDLTFVQATVDGGPLAASYSVTWEKTSGTDWNGNRETLISSPPTSPTGYDRFRIRTNASTFDWPGEYAANTLYHIATVTEIELSGGTIYTPPAGASGVFVPIHRLAGDIHVPWEDNASEIIAYYGALDRTTNLDYSLLRVESDGVTVTDISPVASARPYGVNGYGFAIRAYDNNRLKVLVAGRGNGASADTADDYVGVWVSSDGGDTWTNIVTPTNSAAEHRGAFGGDDSDVIYLWGPAEYISYSANFGTSIDDRSGNLSSFSPANTIGIAGGPIT